MQKSSKIQQVMNKKEKTICGSPQLNPYFISQDQAITNTGA